MSEVIDIPCVEADHLDEGRRVGRLVIMRDVEGTLHAVAAGAVPALCESEDGCVIMLPGGRMVAVPRSMRTVLSWLEVGVSR